MLDSDLQAWIAEHGPYAYHGTLAEHDHAIAEHGLLPFDHPDNPVHARGDGPVGNIGYGTPRPGHVYLTTEPYLDDYERIWQIDLRALAPDALNPDEDWYTDCGTREAHDAWTSYGDDWRCRPGETGGEQAQRLRLGDDTAHTAASLSWGKVAHRGAIPPFALTILDVTAADV